MNRIGNEVSHGIGFLSNNTLQFRKTKLLNRICFSYMKLLTHNFSVKLLEIKAVYSYQCYQTYILFFSRLNYSPRYVTIDDVELWFKCSPSYTQNPTIAKLKPKNIQYVHKKCSACINAEIYGLVWFQKG